MARVLPKRWWIAAAVAALCVLAVVAGILTARDDDPAAAPASESTQTAGLPTGDASGETTTESADGEPAVEAPSGDVQDAEGGTADAPVVSTPPATSEAPAVPAADGATLTTVTAPPEHTLAMIDAARATPGSRYQVVFSVYGFGPPGGAGSLVIAVRHSSPIGDVETPYDFTGRNVLARLTPSSTDVARIGGTYAGTLTLQTSGSVLVPVLGDVRSE